MSGPQAAAGEAGSGRRDTGLQLPGSRCSAPLLRLRGRPPATQIAQRPMGTLRQCTAPGVKLFENRRKVRC